MLDFKYTENEPYLGSFSYVMNKNTISKVFVKIYR